MPGHCWRLAKMQATVLLAREVDQMGKLWLQHGGSGSSSCAVAQSGVSATDRQFGAGTRVLRVALPAAARTVVREPSSLRQGGPTNSPAELEGWISERNCDLRNVLEFGNAGTHRLELC